jgi:hypothetical protein
MSTYSNDTTPRTSPQKIALLFCMLAASTLCPFLPSLLVPWLHPQLGYEAVVRFGSKGTIGLLIFGSGPLYAYSILSFLYMRDANPDSSARTMAGALGGFINIAVWTFWLFIPVPRHASSVAGAFYQVFFVRSTIIFALLGFGTGWSLAYFIQMLRSTETQRFSLQQHWRPAVVLLICLPLVLGIPYYQFRHDYRVNQVRLIAAKSPDTLNHLFAKAVRQHDRDTMIGLAKSKKSPPAVLQQLSLEQDALIQLLVAKNEQTPPDALRRLAGLPPTNASPGTFRTFFNPLTPGAVPPNNVDVLRAVTWNPSTPIDTLRTLTNSTNNKVRDSADFALLRRGAKKIHRNAK